MVPSVQRQERVVAPGCQRTQPTCLLANTYTAYIDKAVALAQHKLQKKEFPSRMLQQLRVVLLVLLLADGRWEPRRVEEAVAAMQSF